MSARPRVHRHLAFALFSGALAIAPMRAASANGRFPDAQYVVVGPASASDIIALRVTFGIALSDDGGKTFHYLCEDALGYGGAAFDPAVGLDDGGRLLVGLYDGALHTSVDRCDEPRIATLEGQFVSDVDTSKDGKVVTVSTATGFTDATNYIYRSEDSAATFTRLGVGVVGTQFLTVEMSPSNDKRLFASALQITPRRSILYRSDDGGETLVDLTAFPEPDAIGAYVAAIDPARPDTVFVRAIVAKVPAPGRSTALLRSDDAGVTWSEVVRSSGLMMGFAISDDGNTLWFGGPDPGDGLQRSTDRGATWTRIGDAQVQCLRFHDGALYVCGTDRFDHYALGRSCDGGDTIHPLLGFATIASVFACPASSTETATCTDRFTAVAATFPAGELPVDSTCPTPGADAGPTDASSLDGSSDSTGVRDADLDAATDAGDDDAFADGDASFDDGSIDQGATKGATVSGSGCDCSLDAAKTGGALPEPALLVVMLGAVAASRRKTRAR